MKKKIIVSIAVVLGVIVAIYGILYILARMTLINVRRGTPDFETGTQWFCSEPEINLTVDEEGCIMGTVVLENQRFDLDVSFYSMHGLRFFIYSAESEFDYIWLDGYCKISSDGDLTIKNIEWRELPSEFPETKLEKKIVLTRIDTGDE